MGVGSADSGIIMAVAVEGSATAPAGGWHVDGVLGVMVAVDAEATASLLLLLLLSLLLVRAIPFGRPAALDSGAV